MIGERARRELVFKARLEKLSKKEAVPNELTHLTQLLFIYALMSGRGERHG